jgi:PadR family transcriptional regulator, regulatory protein AphA
MEPLSKTSYVILGMLSKSPKTGYDIKSLVDVSTRFFWAASYGQIYPELKRLESAGLVAGSDDATGGRQRRLYEITAAGREVLHQWLTAGAPLHFELRHEGLLRFFFADAVGRDEQIGLLRSIGAEHGRVRDQLRDEIRPHALAGSEESGAEFPLHTVEFGIAYQEFIVDWCERMERRLAKTAKTANRS